MNRLFIPLRGDAFSWFEGGAKRFELRRLGRQFTQRLVSEGRPVELRFGYSGRSLGGKIGSVFVGSDLRELLSKVGHRAVIPPASTLDDAVRIAEAFVGQGGPYILFEVKVDAPLRAVAG